jgi:hypothetical protein
MVDIFEDIDIMESALVAFAEGASDEKFAALHSLEKLLLKKKDIIAQFEMEVNNDERLG